MTYIVSYIDTLIDPYTNTPIDLYTNQSDIPICCVLYKYKIVHTTIGH